MAINKINVSQFLDLAKSHLVLDVRSPSEYAHAHFPTALNLPLFSDIERAAVGTSYKQKSREEAIKIGLDYFGPKMKAMIETVEEIFVQRKKIFAKNNKNSRQTFSDKTILVHCWRGGMRSAGVAWLLDLYGFKVYTLEGGYKNFRHWVGEQFTKKYQFKIIGGYTGSGKTLILNGLQKDGFQTTDLEGLANHKGSALGSLGQPPQPTQEMFENLLALSLAKNTSISPEEIIFLEDESQRIGDLQIPMPLWATLRNSPVYFFDIPFEERLNYLTEEYGVHSKEKIVNAILRIQKRLGGLETKNAINFLVENDFKECFRILLTYYDKWYFKGLHNREHAEELIQTITAPTVNTEDNISLLKNKLSIHGAG